MTWEIVYRYGPLWDHRRVHYVTANTQAGAIGMFRHIRGDSFEILEARPS